MRRFKETGSYLAISMIVLSVKLSFRDHWVAKCTPLIIISLPFLWRNRKLMLAPKFQNWSRINKIMTFPTLNFVCMNQSHAEVSIEIPRVGGLCVCVCEYALFFFFFLVLWIWFLAWFWCYSLVFGPILATWLWFFCVVIWSCTIAVLKSGTEWKLNLQTHRVQAMLNIWLQLTRARQGSAFHVVSDSLC